MIQQRMSFTTSTSTIDYIINQINTLKFGGLDTKPSYQRGYVWNNDFKDKLIYSIIKQYPIGNISIRILMEKNEKGAQSEVVDGQQRLITILNFMQGDYEIAGEWSKKILEEIIDFYAKAGEEDEILNKLKKKLNMKGNFKLRYKDLPAIIQGNIKNYNLSLSSISNANNEQIQEYFRFLQNQERLRAGEIINSFPSTPLELYLYKITDKYKLLDIINFLDNRKEFDKIFYSLLGLFDLKISFGTTDKIIQDYVVNTKGFTNSNNKILLNSMIDQLNFIATTELAIQKKTRKRFLKYLLLLSAFNFVDFKIDTYNKLKTLSEIDDLLSVFFSAKVNAEEKTFEEYSKNCVEEFRLIALLTKGGHSITRVKNRMEMLAYYINNINEKTYPSKIIPIESIH